jgi:hypothetical protein
MVPDRGVPMCVLFSLQGSRRVHWPALRFGPSGRADPDCSTAIGHRPGSQGPRVAGFNSEVECSTARRWSTTPPRDLQAGLPPRLSRRSGQKPPGRVAPGRGLRKKEPRARSSPIRLERRCLSPDADPFARFVCPTHPPASSAGPLSGPRARTPPRSDASERKTRDPTRRRTTRSGAATRPTSRSASLAPRASAACRGTRPAAGGRG